MASPSPSNVDQSTRKRGSSLTKSVEEDPVKAEDLKHVEDVVRQKELEEIAHLRAQLQGEQHRSCELEKQLTESEAEKKKVKILEEQVIQLICLLDEVNRDVAKVLEALGELTETGAYTCKI